MAQITNNEAGISVRTTLNTALTEQADHETRILALESALSGNNFPVYVSGATMSPVGIEQAAILNPGVWKTSGFVSYDYSFTVDGVEVANSTATYTPSALEENGLLRGIITVTDGISSDTITLGPVTIVYAAPSITQQPLADQSYIVNSGNKTVDASLAFQGGGITYTIDSSPSGVVIDTNSGSMTITTTSERSGNVVVRATNSGGYITDTFLLSVNQPAYVTDENVSAVNAQGWRATYTNPVSFDPINDPKFISVTRNGYNSTGSATSFEEPVIINTRVREPYPNQSTLTADVVSLSDYIYSTDTLVGVTNNSTRTAPKPIAMWLNHDRDMVFGTTFTVKLAVAHANARNGQPVAAVKFIATDGTNTIEQIVGTMTSEQFSGSGLYAPYFAHTFDFSLLNDGEVTVDAVIYPWVGSSFTISTDGQAYPSVGLTVLKVFNDAGNTLGRTYAYVDPAATPGTGVVSTDPAVAEANPYVAIGEAAIAIRTYNNANYARNFSDGGTVRLLPATHTMTQFETAYTNTGSIIVEAANPANKATTILQDSGSVLTKTIPRHSIFRNITIKRTSSATVTLFDSNPVVGTDNFVACINCTFDASGLTNLNGSLFYRTGKSYIINCDGDDLGQGVRYSTVFKTTHAWGSTNVLNDSLYNGVANIQTNGRAKLFDQPANGSLPVGVGQFFGWNHATQSTDSIKVLTVQEAVNDYGMAIVGNVFEKCGGQTGPAVSISADYILTTAQNVVCFNNTTVGSRTNFLYLDSAGYNVLKYGTYKFNIDLLYNTKSDVFATDGLNVDNWAQLYKAGFRTNCMIKGTNSGDAPSTGSWAGEIPSWGDVIGSLATPITTNFVNDASYEGTNIGGGDYTPGPGSQIPLIPIGLAPYPIDQKGRSIADDGTSRIGAIMSV